MVSNLRNSFQNNKTARIQGVNFVPRSSNRARLPHWAAYNPLPRDYDAPPQEIQMKILNLLQYLVTMLLFRSEILRFVIR